MQEIEELSIEEFEIRSIFLKKWQNKFLINSKID